MNLVFSLNGIKNSLLSALLILFFFLNQDYRNNIFFISSFDLFFYYFMIILVIYMIININIILKTKQIFMRRLAERKTRRTHLLKIPMEFAEALFQQRANSEGQKHTHTWLSIFPFFIYLYIIYKVG